MASEIPLLAKVDVGNEEIVHKDDMPTFRSKNTLPYKGMLSNYRVTCSDGYITTNGNSVCFDIDKDTNLLYTDDDKIFYKLRETTLPKYSVPVFSKTIDSSDIYVGQKIVINGTEVPISYTHTVESNTYTPPISGNLIDEAIINGTTYYIISSSNLYYLVHDDTYELLAGNCAYFTKGVPMLVVSSPSSTTVYDGADTGTSVYFLEYPTNNGFYNDTTFVLGYENDDHYLCRAYVNGTIYYYMGTVGFDGKIYGEPIPVSSIVDTTITYLSPTRLTNGILRWEIDSTATSSITVEEPTSLSNTDTSISANTMTGAYVPYSILFSIDPINNSCDYVSTTDNSSILYDKNASAAVTSSFQRILIGDNNSPGVFDGNEAGDEYVNIFPCKYMFTNVVARKGIDYDYGSGWYKAKYQKLWFGLAEVSSTPYPVLLEEPAHYKYYYDETQHDDVLIDALGSAKISWAKTGTSFKVGIDDDVANETRFWYDATNNIYLRHHIITSDEIDANAWNDFIHTVDFDVQDLPFCRSEKGWTLHYYGDTLLGLSKDGTVVGPFSTQYSGIYYVDNENAVIDYFIYKLSDDTTSTVKLTKVADYLFQINIIGDYNILKENKSTNTWELIRGAVPYQNEMVPSSSIKNLKLLLAEDGSAYNDVWYEAAGVNVSLDDKYPSASALLPPIEVNLFVDTDNLDEFNNSVIYDGNPLLTPITTAIADTDELAVYFTHTQLTTDITYKYSCINGVNSKNSKFADNTWWTTSDIIILPVGVGTEYSSVNYISSTITLPDTYSARLYLSNNTAYLTYNVATQVYHSTAVFTIYTSTYYYDGQAIYYTGTLNSTTANDFVCYAIGMKFLANSGTEAYFYSDYDKSIYTFSGSHTMTKTTPISMFGEPVASVFSSYNQSLYLLNEDTDILVLTGESSALFKNTGATALETIVGGCAFIGDGSWSVYDPKDGDLLDLEIETDWIGDNTQLFLFSYSDIVLYDTEPNDSITVTIYLHTLNGKDTNTWTKDITIKKSEWKNNTYRVRINPTDVTGNAFKLGIKSTDEVHVMAMTIESKKTTAGNNVAKGWR